jgi:hypothetical protein
MTCIACFNAQPTATMTACGNTLQNNTTALCVE